MVGEPLTYHTLQRFVGALGIFNSERRAVAVTEIELGEIAVQVLLAAPLIDALHPALEDAEIAFDGVGVDPAAPILAGAPAAPGCSWLYFWLKWQRS